MVEWEEGVGGEMVNYMICKTHSRSKDVLAGVRVTGQHDSLHILFSPGL